MEENNIIDEQTSPVIEKVSIKEVKAEKTKDETSSKLVDALLALDTEGIRQAMFYVDKKIDKLKNLK